MSRKGDKTTLRKSDYPVGCGKPPQAHQFKPGQSGNPRGRPKEVKSMDELICRALRKRYVITEEGQRRSMPTEEIVAKRIATKAASGDIASIRLAMNARNRVLAELARKEALRPPPEPEHPPFDYSLVTTEHLIKMQEVADLYDRYSAAFRRRAARGNGGSGPLVLDERPPVPMPPKGPEKPIWEEEGYDLDENGNEIT